MCDTSVDNWLKNLRYTVEYYESYEFCACAANFRKDLMEMVRNFECGNNSEELYENIWDCVLADSKLKVNFGEINRVSVDFCDFLEELDVVPIVFEQVHEQLSDDVMLWRSDLRFECSYEEQNLLESQELLKNVRATSNGKTEDNRDVFHHKFPVTEGEEPALRPPRQSVSRPKTYDSSSFLERRSTEFVIDGVVKIKDPMSRDLKLKSKERLVFQSNGLLILNEWGQVSQKLIERNFFKHVKQSGKLTVEIQDRNNGTFTLTFSYPKHLKEFLENEHIRKYVDKTSLMNALNRFFVRKRPSRDDLMKKGIYQYETIFDNSLINVYTNANNTVPKFITNIIELIEIPDNIQSVGVYRASGNLAVIQKIRTEVDKGQLEILQQHANDVDVLTGSLKLFFRELKEPLFPSEIVEGILNVFKNNSSPQKEIIGWLKRLPEAHLETMFVLFNHLLEVDKHKEENKMDIYNLSVCWAPTLVFFKQPCKDLVSQSADATKFMDLLLTFYRDNRCEMGKLLKRPVALVKNESTIRYNSKESIHKKSTNSISDSSYEIVKKLTDLITQGLTTDQLNIEGLYKKSGSTDKITKIMKRIAKNRLNELDKFKFDIHDLAGALKKYLRELQEPLLPKEILQLCCDKNIEQIQYELERNPKRDSLSCLLDHINLLVKIENNHKIPRKDMINIWANVLSFKQDPTSTDKYAQLLEKIVDGLDRNSINSTNNLHFSNDRLSQYDNVPSSPIKTKIDVSTVKTESTKL